MKIFLLTVGTVNYNCDINFYEPLKSLFSRVIYFNYIKRISKIGKKAMNEEIIELVKKKQPDYVFFLTYHDQIDNKTLDKISQLGTKIIAWFTDDHWRFDNYSRFIAEHVHCSVTTDKIAYLKYKKHNFRVIKSQWAANPKYYHPVPVNETHEVTFVGQNYGPRGKVIEFLRKNKIPIEAFGRGWGGYLPFEKIVSLFSSSKINLNFSASSKDEKIKQIKGRVFEVPMCGGFLLTDYVEGLEEYFKIGKEIVCYDSNDDLIDKIRYYLQHEDEREKIAKAGYEISIEKHTWEKRLRDVFEKAGKMKKMKKNKSAIEKIRYKIEEVLLRRD